MSLELYHALYSTCSQKVRFCLFEKGLDWQSRPVDLAKGEQLDPAYLRLNPNGVVPTLLHDGEVVTESSVIVEYLDEVFPAPPLMPAQALDKARLRAWMHYIDEVPTAFIRYATLHVPLRAARRTDPKAFAQSGERRPLRRFLFRQVGESGFSDDAMLAAFDGLRQTVQRVDAAVAARGPWIMGADFSLADILLTPTIDRMEDLGMSEMWTDLPGFGAWWARLKKRPAFAATYSPGARISERMPEIRESVARNFAKLLQRNGRQSLRG
jgi:glutathione S-transferase